MTQRRYEFDRFSFDPDDGTLADRESGARARLRPQAARLLAVLLDRAGRLVDRDTLVEAVWGPDRVVDFDAGLAALLRELRTALESVGDDPERIETLPRRGVRINASISTSRGTRGHGSGVRWWLGLAALSASVAAAAVATALWLRDLPPGGESVPADSWSLALLPLVTTDGSAEDRMSIVLADTLLAELWRAELPSLALIGRAGMRPYAGRDDVASAVARDLGVDLLVEGSYRTGSDGWRVDVRLLATPPGRVVWSHSLSGPEAELPVSDVAARLVEQLAEDWPRLRQALAGRSVSGGSRQNFRSISSLFDGNGAAPAARYVASQSNRSTE